MTAPLRVLILEDRPTDAEWVAVELRRVGFDLDWLRVETKQDYVAHLNPALDLILADYSLPQFDALRALHLLQEHGLDIPFIVVTGSFEEKAVECMKQGAADYLLKDRLTRLGPAVTHALEQKRLRDAKRRTDAALRESEERFRRLAENAQDTIYRYEFIPQRHFAYVSPVCTAMTGYTPEEYYADPDLIFKLIHPKGLPPQESRDWDQIAPAMPMISCCLRKDGTTIWTEQRNVPVYDQVGNLMAVEGIIRDITERKQAEERLTAIHSLGQKLVFSRDITEIAQSVIDTAYRVLQIQICGLWLVDTERQVLTRLAHTARPEEPEMPPLPLEGESGISVAVVRTGEPAYLPDVRQDPRYIGIYGSLGSELCIPLKVGVKVIGVLNAESDQRDAFSPADRQLMEALANVAAIALENARLHLAEREQLRRLQKSQEQLIQAEKMGALGRLVASIVHEINNPLQAIQGSLTLAQEELEGGALREKLARYLNMAESEIDRIGNIVRRLRDFYRPARQVFQPTEVHVILDSVLTLAGKQLQHNNVTVEREWEDGLPLIQANPDHLKQVFLNLVLNAADAIAARHPPDSKAGGTLWVRTALDQMQRQDGKEVLPAVRIEFADTGEGMPPEILNRLFEPFLTTKKDGTGLGLSISFGIIQAHNGRITAASQVGVGTTFTILLPAA